MTIGLDEVQELFKQHRTEIDSLDETIIAALGRRFEIVREVGRIKAERDIPVVQSARAEEVKKRVAEMGKAKGLDPVVVRHIYTLLIDYAHNIENDYLD